MFMRIESLTDSYFALPDGAGPHPGVVAIHEASGLNDNIRDICRRLPDEGYAALGVDLFDGHNRAVCMARMFVGAIAGNLDHFGTPALRDALGRLADRPELDADRIGALGFCLGGSIVLTWACTENRLKAIAPYHGSAPKPRAAIRRLCPVVGSWPDKDFTTKAAGILETELTAAGIPTTSRCTRAPSTPSSTTPGATTTPTPQPTPGDGCSRSSQSTSRAAPPRTSADVYASQASSPRMHPSDMKRGRE